MGSDIILNKNIGILFDFNLRKNSSAVTPRFDAKVWVLLGLKLDPIFLDGVVDGLTQ